LENNVQTMRRRDTNRRGAIAPWVEKSICIPAVEYPQQSHCDDLQIEGETPVAKILEIVFDAFRDSKCSRASRLVGSSREFRL